MRMAYTRSVLSDPEGLLDCWQCGELSWFFCGCLRWLLTQVDSGLEGRIRPLVPVLRQFVIAKLLVEVQAEQGTHYHTTYHNARIQEHLDDIL